MRKLPFLIVTCLLSSASSSLVGSVLEYRVSAAKGPYFLCDDRVVEDRWLLDRVSIPLKKHPANPVMTKSHAWEGTGPMPLVAHYDREQSLYRMWYLVWSPERYFGKQPFSYNVAYAESADGISWRRPELGIFDRLPEDPKSNLIKLGREKTQGVDVELNPKPGVIPGRYIAVHNEAGGLFISTSDDGKEFTFLHDKPTVPYHSDTNNNLVYDEVRDRWLIYCRPRAYAGDHKRRVSVQESTDLKNWTHERTILVPDEDELQEFYGMTVFRRGDLFFGLIQVFDRDTGSMHSEIAWSGDGISWRQIGTHPALLELGSKGEWDSGMVFAVESPIVIGDELRFYYCGAKEPHGGAKEDGKAPTGPPSQGPFQTMKAGLALGERDRLVGMRPRGPQAGFALTRSFVRPSDKDLVINATVENLEKGAIRVELRDDLGRPIPGFSLEDCDPIRTSTFSGVVRWRGRAISDVPTDEVRLQFEVSGGTLFAYDFVSR